MPRYLLRPKPEMEAWNQHQHGSMKCKRVIMDVNSKDGESISGGKCLNLVVHEKLFHYRSILVIQTCMMQPNTKLQRMSEVLVSDLREDHLQVFL